MYAASCFRFLRQAVAQINKCRNRHVFIDGVASRVAHFSRDTYCRTVYIISRESKIFITSSACRARSISPAKTAVSENDSSCVVPSLRNLVK